MDSRIRSKQFLSPPELHAYMAVSEVAKLAEDKIKEAIEDLKVDGVQDFTEAQVDSFYDSVQMCYIIQVSVPASARPEDW